jgi:hypothetical protein
VPRYPVHHITLGRQVELCDVDDFNGCGDAAKAINAFLGVAKARLVVVWPYLDLAPGERAPIRLPSALSRTASRGGYAELEKLVYARLAIHAPHRRLGMGSKFTQLVQASPLKAKIRFAKLKVVSVVIHGANPFPTVWMLGARPKIDRLSLCVLVDM